MGTELDIGECGMGNRRSHVFVVRGEGVCFSRELRDREGEESFYIPGEVPWQRKTPFLEAKSLLRWNIPSIGQDNAVRTWFLCDK